MARQGTQEIHNGMDVIDSRDVIARIEYLKDEVESLKDDAKKEAEEAEEEFDEEAFLDDCDEARELKALEDLAEEVSGSPDWTYGETLIRDTYFEEYAEQMAEDIVAIDRNAKWPLNHIDWEAAADELKQDYMSVDFDGEKYWIRA